jgi:membrane protein DedA with SNARE-associated domain
MIVATTVHALLLHGVAHHVAKVAEDLAIGIAAAGFVIGGAIFYPIGHATGKRKGRRQAQKGYQAQR